MSRSCAHAMVPKGSRQCLATARRSASRPLMKTSKEETTCDISKTATSNRNITSHRSSQHHFKCEIMSQHEALTLLWQLMGPMLRHNASRRDHGGPMHEASFRHWWRPRTNIRQATPTKHIKHTLDLTPSHICTLSQQSAGTTCAQCNAPAKHASALARLPAKALE